MKKLMFVAILLLTTVPFVQAQKNEDYKKHPGYVDFGSLDQFKDAEETVEVFIKGPLLKFVSRATSHEDPDLARLLDNLVVIKVNTFSIDAKDYKEVRDIINNVSKKLDPQKWELMVRAKESDEYTEIYTQFGNDDKLLGLVVMAVEENDEAAFINIAGDIDPSQLGKLSSKFDIPELDSLEIDAKTHHVK
ncbi:DUF4252 domain-containing protein [candidate division KSB1 bacterium]|nr:DUF4252 domain-containing protein [candidate division KSB1 bacterium]